MTLLPFLEFGVIFPDMFFVHHQRSVSTCYSLFVIFMLLFVIIADSKLRIFKQLTFLGPVYRKSSWKKKEKKKLFEHICL